MQSQLDKVKKELNVDKKTYERRKYDKLNSMMHSLIRSTSSLIKENKLLLEADKLELEINNLKDHLLDDMSSVVGVVG